MNMTVPSQVDFELNPQLFLDYAAAWAAGGPPPDAQFETWLQTLPRPLLKSACAARESFWKLLSNPERGRALAWLDRVGILPEILPVWSGDAARRKLRLQAVEEIHRERWADGLGTTQFDWLCVYMDQQADGRLGGWALTGLAALLLAGDRDAPSHAELVSYDLRALGANEGERERVLTAVREYPLFGAAIQAEQTPLPRFAPTTVVATLATCFAEAADAALCKRAMQVGDRALARHAAGTEPL